MNIEFKTTQLMTEKICQWNFYHSSKTEDMNFNNVEVYR